MRKRYRSALFATLAAAMLAVLTVPITAGAQPSTTQKPLPNTVTYKVTVHNLTVGQPFTPPVLVTHSRRTDLYTAGEAASAAIQGLAENGDVPGLVGSLDGVAGIGTVTVAATPDGPLLAGESVTVEIETSKRQRRLSLASMLICSNDGFAGLDSIKLPRAPGRSVSIPVNAYDAGTETNTELFADIVPPCGPLSGVDSGGQGTGATDPALAENGVITSHPGVGGSADLDSEIHDWDDPVAMVTVTRVDNARRYSVTIENLTSGQPLTPPVAATHNRRVDIFEVGDSASEAIQNLAENGDVPGLVASLKGVRGVRDIVVTASPEGPPPVLPGHEVSFEIFTSKRGRNLISIASMLICSNDGFTGIDSIRLPKRIGKTKTIMANGYDAGTETNTELFADMVPPCGPLTGVDSGGAGTGASDPALAENGVITMHGGVTGSGDLDATLHGWDGAAAKITITRLA
ncbi:MAG: spondin domain-containing protein [Acidimicrobiales bacterium]